MHLPQLLAQGRSALSFEFFPPNTTEGHDRLRDTIEVLGRFHPDFVSITYGAGGSTQESTAQWVKYLKDETSLNPVPHLTCVNQTREEMVAILARYASWGVKNVLALRGDAPKGVPDHCHQSDAFPLAKTLVQHLRENPITRDFGVGVAGFPEGHPACPNRLLEMDHLKAKIDAGADYLCTQLFFDNRDFHDYRERCALAGIHVPILAGILPITSVSGVRRISQLAGRCRIPAPLWKQLLRFEHEPSSVLEIGLHHATEQARDLLDHSVAGLHFFTMNQSEATAEILRRLGYSSRASSLG